jgi:hypothetical protein
MTGLMHGKQSVRLLGSLPLERHRQVLTGVATIGDAGLAIQAEDFKAYLGRQNAVCR